MLLDVFSSSWCLYPVMYLPSRAWITACSTRAWPNLAKRDLVSFSLSSLLLLEDLSGHLRKRGYWQLYFGRRDLIVTSLLTMVWTRIPSLFPLGWSFPSKAMFPPVSLLLSRFLILPGDPGKDVPDVVQNSGWEAASEPQARRSSAEQPVIAGTGGLSATHCFIQSYDG